MLLALLLFLLGRHSLIQPASGQEPRGASYALLVACDNYDKRQLRPLPYTRNDIIGLQNILLESGFKADNIIALHEEQPAGLLPGGANIRAQLKRLLQKVGGNDALVVALSGHGVQFKGEAKHYFCPRDASLEDRGTLVELGEVYQMLARCPSRRKLLLVDACRNDPRSQLSRSTRPTLELESVTRPQQSKVPEGLVALFSCSANQESYEDPELGHGIFFYELMKGWHEAAVSPGGQVELHNLIRYAVQQTARHAKALLKAKQLPEQKNEFAEDWTLTAYTGEVRRLTAAKLTEFNTVQLARNGRWVVAVTRGNGPEDATPWDAFTRPELLIWDAVSGRLLRRWQIHVGVS
jgi:uncharacterized caspase-like protein